MVKKKRFLGLNCFKLKKQLLSQTFIFDDLKKVKYPFKALPSKSLLQMSREMKHSVSESHQHTSRMSFGRHGYDSSLKGDGSATDHTLRNQREQDGDIWTERKIKHYRATFL